MWVYSVSLKATYLIDLPFEKKEKMISYFRGLFDLFFQL